MGKKERNLAIGTLVGLSAGYLAGILTAKKSGKETRKDIANKAVAAKKYAEKKIKDLHSTLVSMLSEAEALIKTTKSGAKAGFEKAIENAKKARDNTREVLSAVHEGDASDADLKQAIDEANSAIEHLKTFIDKEK